MFHMLSDFVAVHHKCVSAEMPDQVSVRNLTVCIYTSLPAGLKRGEVKNGSARSKFSTTLYFWLSRPLIYFEMLQLK